MNGTSREVEVAIVGGGPAGAAVATRLADAGVEVALFERLAAPRWRASGVYSSPSTSLAMLDLGLPPEHVARLVRPVSELVVETVAGASCRLAHGDAGPAVGVDRVRLEEALLRRARATGAEIHEGAAVRAVTLPDRDGPQGGVRLDVSLPGTGQLVFGARLVVGADGPRSLVARSAGVPARRPIRRAGVTVHRADPAAAPEGEPMTARLVFGRGWYCGATPVPGARVNLGMVFDERVFRARLALAGGPGEVVEGIVAEVPRSTRVAEAWREAAPTDAVAVALPLAHRVRRLAGPRFLLVGDSAGFIDPVSGEGLHRAFLTAELAADAIGRWRAGDRDALLRYDRLLRRRFARKDLISWLLQLFMTRPGLLEYAVRRLERRDGVRRTFGLVMSDLAPPERALDPRFLAALLAP